MRIKALGRQIIDEMKFRSYPTLTRLAEKAVDEILDVASIRSRSQLEGWFYRKVAAVKRHFLVYSEVEKMVQRAGFNNIEEARAAVKVLTGELPKEYDHKFVSGAFPVFISTNDKFLSEKTAYIYFLAFLGKVGEKKTFSNVDFSPAATKLFQRALWDGIIEEKTKGVHDRTWKVVMDPMHELRRRVQRLPVKLQIILAKS